MLVLSRKPGEQIQIDGHITVTVLDVEGKRIRLGIDAPREVPIVRTELTELKDAFGSANDLSSYRSVDRKLDHRMSSRGAAWDF